MTSREPAPPAGWPARFAAVGGSLVDGFDLVADEVGFDDALEGADLVVTGEGFVDAQSFEGKVVGGVAERAAAAGVPLLVVAGEVYDDAGTRVEAVSLVERFGDDRARRDPAACVERDRARAPWPIAAG